MPRSSRHKSSKHREYSDSEKESSLKERKGKEESSGGGSGARVSKEAGSAEKRKLDSKENRDSGNGEYVEEYSSSSSKRRKEKEKEKEKERERVFVVIDDGVSDRWNGGGGGAAEDERVEGPKRSKDKEKERSAESKSKRREDESEEVVKKGSGKSEGKNRESTGRKEIERERDREREKERERKGKEGKSEKVVDGDDPRSAKQSSEKIELNALDLLQSPEPENEPDRRMRRKRDGSGDVDKYQDEIGEVRERRFSSREDGAKDGRLKDEKHKDDRYRDKYREDMDRESRHREEKPKDERASRGYTTSRSDDRHSRDEKDIVENRQKKSKPQDSDGDRDHEFDSRRERGRGYDRESYQRDRDREHEHDRDRNRDRERERVRDRDRDYDRDYDWDWDRDKDRDRDHDRDRDRDHDRERDRDKYRDRDHDLDYDGALTDDRSVRYKDSRGKKRSPDDRDDYSDSKSRGVKAPYSDMDKKSMSSTRVESDAERGRSQSRQTYLDNEESCNRRMNSPNSSSHGGADDYRDSKYRDSLTEQRAKVISSRELTGFTGAPERGSKYRFMEKPIKMEDGNVLEPSLERSSSSKASPRSLVDRSPSSTGHERRYLNRTGVRRSMEIEEPGRRTGGSMTARDLPAGHERQNWDSPFEKPLVDESASADSSFYRLSQSNSTLNPFLGALEEDGRVAGGRYKRSGDPNLGRGQGNTWRSTPNWSSPITNGYLPPFHAPPASFQPIIPQFPTPPMFGVRPSMEVNHSGIPYPITDADRFSSHLRPIGWQNVMDGSTPSHLHGWDGNNAVFREETHMYGGSEWDQNRHSITGRGWENNGDMWKGKTDDNKDISLASVKEDLSMQAPVDPVLAGQVVQRSQNESNFQGAEAKPVETKPPVISSPKGLTASPKVTAKGTLDPPKTYSDDDAAHFSQAYLSNLDISVELAGSELYRQCMSLLNTEHSKAVGEDTAVLVNLKDGARAVPKSSSTLLHLSLPAPSNAVFQRAMDIYKKLRVGFSGLPIVNGGKVDMICANNNEEQVHGDDAEKSKALIPNGDTPMLDLQTLDINQKGEASPITDVQAPAGESVSNLSRVVNVEGLDQSPNHDGPEKLTDSVCGSAKIEVMPSEHMKSEEVAEDLVPNSHYASQAGAVLPADGPNDGIDTIEHNNNTFHCAEDGQGLGVAVSGPLYISDGSPNASVALMPGSNESGSVNLSRIHDSPESTH